MKYLDREDLIAVVQEHFLDDSTQFDDNIVDNLEEKAIAFVVSYTVGRYKTDLIFGDSAIKHPILIFVIARLVVYWTLRRNAARKVPEDYSDIYDEAIKILENIQNGIQKLPGLPADTADDGTSSAKLMYGNTTNPNFFI